MLRFSKIIMLMVLLACFGLGAGHAFAEEPSSLERGKNTQLTEEQQKELENLHTEILDLRKELMEKYVEYGIFSKEQAEDYLSHMESRFERLKQNGFIPHWHWKVKERGKEQ
ncbi:MAG: hypothetical protein C6P37_11505 [Caldibacillus debilis]|uniref:DUF2680 domain-containing protein n=1 Tax=Caldibacillus debilis TaxID=301148 RepID=A0A3E0K2U8_9BACI|nr:MAG: hypothetical protein BAA03_03375 [Caldibacillus debilis]REJ17605.1 MAG: hypothetical protein C6W57_05145 [Caldibacillus debilis]REJ27438.1 MAG: hypothetical protein C6P37_11505 [Caldibacillus debilis]